jgi:hypothetical protein
MRPPPLEYDLYLDESGLFQETSLDPAQRSDPQVVMERRPSQLAGLLVEHGALTESAAQQVLARAQAAAGVPLGEAFKGASLPAGDSYDRVVLTLVADLEANRWQPVRLVNQERVPYRDRATAYTSILAEIALRVFALLERKHRQPITLHLIPAAVYKDNTETSPLLVDEQRCTERVLDALSFLAIRRGVAGPSAGWRLGSLRLRSGRTWPELRLCDLVSNASYGEFKCQGAARTALSEALGDYNLTLTVRELTERVEDYLADGSLGLAVMALCAYLVRDEGDRADRARADELLNTTLGRLAELGAPGRDPQLQIVDNWLEQLVDVRRALGLGGEVADWLLRRVESVLRRRLAPDDQPTLDWFSFALRTWALASCNHRGLLEQARDHQAKLTEMLPALAGRWEHVRLLMHGLLAEAVHLTDCYAHAAACARARAVAEYYGALAGLFQDAFPDVFKNPVRSDLRGKALGTWLHADVYARLGKPQELGEARRNSDEAMREFSSPADWHRQEQYRCQLETAAGRYADARAFLALALEIPGQDTHQALASALVELGAKSLPGQGFVLLHWLRLGAECCLRERRDEAEAFREALRASKLLDSDWCSGEMKDYPAHGILRRCAVIQAWEDRPTDAVKALVHLQALKPLANRQWPQVTVLQAALAEVAALLWDQDRASARRLLESDRQDQPGLLQLLDGLRRGTKDTLPELWAFFAGWPDQVARILSGNLSAIEVRDRLLPLARLVGC